MNLFTVPMKLLVAVVLDEDAEKVTEALLRLGVLDFVHLEKLAPEHASKFRSMKDQQQRQLYTGLRLRVETLYRQASLSLPPIEKLDFDVLFALDPARVSSTLERIESDLAQLREQQKRISQSQLALQELLQYCTEAKYQYLDIHVGRLGTKDQHVLQDRLANYAHVLAPLSETDDYALLFLRRDRSQIEPLLEKLHWEENVEAKERQKALPILTTVLTTRVKELEESGNRVKDQIAKRIRDEQQVLEPLWYNLYLHELIAQINSYFSHTRNTTIFSGWVPKDSASEVEREIRAVTNGVCVIEWTDDKYMPRKEIPVAVPDVPLLRPFQNIVYNYSVPEYGTVNPVPFVAVSYLAMFGLMFADAGQGLIILLLGIIGVRYFSRHPEKNTPHRIITPNLCDLMMYLGGAAIVFGMLFGSYFGYNWLPPLWFDYHGAVMGHETLGRNVYDILGITIWFGIGIISLGLILNWINLAGKKDWFHLVFDKNGLVGGWLFGCGVWAASYFVESGYKQLPSGLFLPFAFGVPVLLLLAKVPIHYLVARRSQEEIERPTVGKLVMESILEWIVDLLEIFSGFLANTLSFMRVAGLGIAHASLMAAFFEMAALVGPGVGECIVLVLGNALVIVLEGLSAGIQALRLNYYEFFTKFYTGGGLAYHPVALHPHRGKQATMQS